MASPVIDVHTHCLTEAWFQLLQQHGGPRYTVKAVTGVPIKFLGTGEAIDRIETFRPEGMASRILGMGDIVGLVEQVAGKIDEKDAMKSMQRMAEGKFDFYDFLDTGDGAVAFAVVTCDIAGRRRRFTVLELCCGRSLLRRGLCGSRLQRLPISVEQHDIARPQAVHRLPVRVEPDEHPVLRDVDRLLVLLVGDQPVVLLLDPLGERGVGEVAVDVALDVDR